ncbi:MAG: DUF177 domain-containing protein [Salinivirgaceae bacterium]|jgi:uncharacterized protein|nr:DUF177 domain-containing protein [Salinivirgaceae bacterium]
MNYKIPFRGLINGKHQYNYSIDEKFFESFSESEIKKGEITVEVELIKRSTGVESLFDIKGAVTVPCDRCLDDMSCPIECEGKIFFEFGQETEEVSDELVMVGPEVDYLELDVYIYEYINLSLPIQKIHNDDEDENSLCNAEMLAKLNSMTANNDDDKIDDPRWDNLRDLIN